MGWLYGLFNVTCAPFLELPGFSLYPAGLQRKLPGLLKVRISPIKKEISLYPKWASFWKCLTASQMSFDFKQQGGDYHPVWARGGVETLGPTELRCFPNVLEKAKESL